MNITNKQALSNLLHQMGGENVTKETVTGLTETTAESLLESIKDNT